MTAVSAKAFAQGLCPRPELVEPVVIGNPLGHGDNQIEHDAGQIRELLTRFLQLDL